MQLTTWHPFQDMDDMFRRYARLIDSRVPATVDKNGRNVTAWTPSADISETKKEYLIKAELPEVKKSDVQVSIDNGRLTLAGERKFNNEEDDETYHRVESFHGRFSRTFTLPDNIDETKVKAECKNGILRVHLPKTKKSTAQSSIDVAVG